MQILPNQKKKEREPNVLEPNENAEGWA